MSRILGSSSTIKMRLRVPMCPSPGGLRRRVEDSGRRWREYVPDAATTLHRHPNRCAESAAGGRAGTLRIRPRVRRRSPTDASPTSSSRPLVRPCGWPQVIAAWWSRREQMRQRACRNGKSRSDVILRDVGPAALVSRWPRRGCSRSRNTQSGGRSMQNGKRAIWLLLVVVLTACSITQNVKPVTPAALGTREMGGGRVDKKFIKADEKVRELVNQLFPS